MTFPGALPDFFPYMEGKWSGKDMGKICMRGDCGGLRDVGCKVYEVFSFFSFVFMFSYVFLFSNEYLLFSMRLYILMRFLLFCVVVFSGRNFTITTTGFYTPSLGITRPLLCTWIGRPWAGWGNNDMACMDDSAPIVMWKGRRGSDGRDDMKNVC